MARKRKRKYTREAWQALVKTVEQQKAMQAPEPQKDEGKVEVHIHNHPGQAVFERSENSADIAMKRMIAGRLL